MLHPKVTRAHFSLACYPGFAFLDPAGFVLRQVRLDGHPVGCPVSVLKIDKGLLDGTLALSSN